MPIEKINMNSKGIGNNKNVHDKLTLLPNTIIPIVTKTIAKSEKIRLKKDDKTLETGNIYFGIYTFLMSEALSMIALIALEVDSEKKANIICPVNK
jgi:hypothetical protein